MEAFPFDFIMKLFETFVGFSHLFRKLEIFNEFDLTSWLLILC